MKTAITVALAVATTLATLAILKRAAPTIHVMVA